MDNKEIILEEVQLPDGSTVKCYVYPSGKRTIDINDVMRAVANPINKEALQAIAAKAAQSTFIPPQEEEKPKKPERKLSEFNQKLKQGLNWNPKNK